MKIPPGGSLLRSASVRFGVIYAALFGISAAALAAFLWWSTAGLLERQIETAIQIDSSGLVERFVEGGRGLLLDEDWRNLPIERAGVASLARIHYFELPGGLHLLIGRDIQNRAEMRELLADGMLWAAAVAVALGTLGAWAVRGLFRATISDVSATAMAISAGDLTRRVRVAGSDDEFDLLAKTVNDMLDRIGLLMDGVRQVSNAIAHDLRTPITRARMRLEDAASHATTEADLRAAVDRATADLDGVVAVFQALLRISEIEAGARRSAFVAFDLAPVLEDLAELYEAVADERDMAFLSDISVPLPSYGDRDMIQQAVANLLDNALKFSPTGGTIRLVAVPQPDGVVIEVIDEGPGISENDRARATDRFFRGETARSTPGSGLGLSLVLAVAQLHGGGLDLLDAAPGLRAVITLRASPQAQNLVQGGAAVHMK